MKKVFLFLATAVLALGMSVSANAAEIDAPLKGKASKTITVTNPNKPDTKAPTVSSVKLANKDVIISGYTGVPIEIYVKAKDDMSGIMNIQIVFENKDGDELYFASGPYNYDKKTKQYTALEYINNTKSSGIYKFVRMSLCDFAGNERVYSANTKKYKATEKTCPKYLKNLKINVGYLNSKMTPTITNFNMGAVDYSNSEYVAVPFHVEAGATNGKLSAVGIVLERNDGTKWDSWAEECWDDSIGGIKEGVFDLAVTNDYYFPYGSEGKWRVSSLVFYEEDGSFVKWDKDKLPKDIADKEIVIKLPSAENDFPTVSKVEFTSNKASIKKNAKDGGTISLKVSASDKTSGICYIYANIMNEETGILYSSSVYYAEGKKNKVTAKLKINLPKNLASGTYIINDICVIDNAYHEFHYAYSTKGQKSDRWYKYKKQSSDVRKMKVTVKNTYKKNK